MMARRCIHPTCNNPPFGCPDTEVKKFKKGTSDTSSLKGQQHFTPLEMIFETMMHSSGV